MPRFIQEVHMRCVKSILIVLIAALLSSPITAHKVLAAPAQEATPTVPTVDELFAERDWKSLNALAASPEGLTPRELSLCANALWYQSRWDDARVIMEKLDKCYPDSVRPYARLLIALALERTKQTSAAYDRALKLYNDKTSSSLVRYYSMYCLERLTTNPDEKEKWLRLMADAESNSSRRAAVLSELSKIDRLTPTDALEVLRYRPQDEGALKIAEKAPASAQKDYRLGYAAYLRSDYETAVRLLSRLKFDSPYGESGTYYLGVSLQKLDRSPEAEPLMEKLVYRKDADYIQRAMSRLSLMAGGKADAAALAALKKMASDENGTIAEAALHALAGSRWSIADKARDEYLKRFPQTQRANRLRWSRGWKKFCDGDANGALKDWAGAGSTSAQLLYWRAKGCKLIGDAAKADNLINALLEKHALTVYAFLAKEGGSLTITDEPLPKELTPAEPSDLERWGFMTHARMLLEDKKDLPSRARRAKIAAWLGQEWQSYRDLRSYVDPLLKGSALPRSLLEIMYPRPFRSVVEREAKKYGVDPLFIWSVMRQESAFDPTASSWVGAAGLMQLMPATAAGEAKKMGLKKYRLYSVEDNIAMGASHISGLMARFGRLDHVAAAYNAGGGNVNKWKTRFGNIAGDKWLESIPFRETNGYVKNVLRNYAVYQKLYGKVDLKELIPMTPPGAIPVDTELETPEVLEGTR